MKAYRTKPRTTEQIRQSIAKVLMHASDECKAVHLIPCDFEKLASYPDAFDCVEQSDGKIVTVFRGGLVEVVVVE